MTQFKPHDYQLYAINYIYNHPYCGLFLDMGLGKTAISLFALLTISMNEPLGHVLLVAPKTIAELTWTDEINKWDQLKETRYKNLTGLSKKKREEELAKISTEPPTLYIVNSEIFIKLVDYYGSKWPFEVVFIDEYQSFKNPKAKRVKALRKVRKHIKRLVGLTGTPAPKNISDLWAEISLLDGGERLGYNLTQFRNQFMYPSPYHRTPQGYPYLWFLKDGAENEIYKRISDIVISMKAIDHLNMPEITYNNILCEMTPKEYKIYKQLEKDKVLELTNGETIEAVNAGALHGLLAQLANGAIYEEIGSKNYLELHNAKINTLKNMVDELQGEPLIVFYAYQHDKERILNAIPEAIAFDGSQELKNKWNNGEIPVMLLQPASHAHGINLQDGGHTICWFSIPSNLEHYKQGNARLYRQGQKNNIIIHHLITNRTVDTKIIRSLQEKDANQDAILNAVKAQLRKDIT